MIVFAAFLADAVKLRNTEVTHARLRYIHSRPCDKQVEQFITEGFVRVDQAFPRVLAEEAKSILWRDLPGHPDYLATWKSPVVRLGMYTAKPFVDAANTPLLHAAFDRLVGAGRWLPCAAMGTFPVRFPLAEDPGDGGWIT